MEILIRYGTSGDYEEWALALARRLFAELGEEIDALTLFPLEQDEYDVTVNGVLLHSTRATGEMPRAVDILAAIRPG